MKDTVYRYDIPMRIALLADLHDRPFEWIINSLSARRPEMICIAGDLIDRSDRNDGRLAVEQVQNVLPFLKACSAVAPTFVSLGDHEYPLCDDDLSLMRETGAVILDNSFVTLGGVVIGGLNSAGVMACRRARIEKNERYPEWSHGNDPDYTRPDISFLEGFCRQDPALPPPRIPRPLS